MNNVTVVSHFSLANWPIVNKLSAICKCLEVTMVHCSAIEKLRSVMKELPPGRRLFFTDEGLVSVVQEIETQSHGAVDVAMFINSPISKVAEKINTLRSVKYLIGGQNAESTGRDLSILIKKYTDGDILDLDKYLAFGCKIHTRVVNSAKAKRDAIDSVAKYISRLGDPGYRHPFDEYARRISELTDELLLNAIFNANPRLRNADRGAQFHLQPEEEVRMSFGYDGDYFGVSVRDPFGQFNPDTIMSYLATNRESGGIAKSKSAGLGLKFIFEKAHQIVANVKEERATEVIALVRFSSRLLEFEKQKKSFYFFDSRRRA